MTQLRFTIQCVSILLAGMLLSNAACSPGASESDIASERDAATYRMVTEIHTEEAINWALGKVLWSRCQDRNFLTRQALSDLENQACDQAQTESEFVARARQRLKEDYPLMAEDLAWVLNKVGGFSALIRAQQERLPIVGLTTAALPASWGAILAGLAKAAAIPLAIIVAATIIISYARDRVHVVGPLLSELATTLVEFVQNPAETSVLLRVAELQRQIIVKLEVLFQAAGLAVIPFVANLMSLIPRTVAAYNTAPLQLSHTVPATLTDTQARIHSYLATNNIVRYSPVVTERLAVFEQLLASSSTIDAPVFRANVENVVVTLAGYGVTVSRSLQSAIINRVDGLGEQAGFEGVYEINLPTTCQTSGCSSSMLTIWLPAANALVNAQVRPVVFASVLLADANGGQTILLTSGAAGDVGDATTTASQSADVAAALRELAKAAKEAAEAQAKAVERAGADVADALRDQAAEAARQATALENLLTEYKNNNQPPKPDLCNKVGSILATAAPITIGAIQYGRLKAEDCATCEERFDKTVVVGGAAAVTTWVLKRRLFNLLQSAAAKTIGRLVQRIASKTWACSPNPFEGYDLAIGGATAIASSFAIGGIWSWLTTERVGEDWRKSFCEGPMECVNPEEDFAVPGEEGEEGAARLEYTQCSGTEQLCEDRCVASCREYLAELGEAYGAACDRICSEFDDAAAGEKNPATVCAGETVDTICAGGLTSQDAWLSLFEAQGWVSCADDGTLAPSVADCP